MYHKKNVDYIYLMWEDLVYQVDNKNSKKNNDMCYPRFTKVIIDYFMSKNQSISRRNKMFWHTARDDPMFNTIKVISRQQDTQIYSVILPDVLTNQEILDSKAYKEYYAVASGAVPPKARTKYKNKTGEPVTSPKSKTAFASKGTRLKSKSKVTKPDMKKQPAKKTKAKGFAVLFEVALSEAEQIKLATKEARKISTYHMQVAQVIELTLSQRFLMSKNKRLLGDSEDEDDNDDDGDDGKPLICCKCEGPLRGGFCWFCASRVETSFANDPNPNSFDESQNLSEYSPQPQNETYLCELCGNDSHYGYDCPTWFPLFSDVHQPSKEISIDELKIMMQSNCERMNQQREQEALLAAQREQELREQEQAAQEKETLPQKSNFHQLIEEICGIKVCEEQKQNMEDTMLELLDISREKKLYCMHNNVDDLIECALNSKLLSINLKSQRLNKEKQEVKNIVEHYCNRTVLPTEEPDNSLSMGDEHLSTISETESNEVIKSSVENLILIPSESEVTSDNQSECNVPVCDDFTTISNPLFDCNDDFTFSDKKSLSNEDVLMIYSNSLVDDEESISLKIDPHYFNAESNLLESLLNQDTLIESSPKFDYFLEEFSGELAHIDPIPPGIKEADFDLEEEIRLVENLLYDNSSPRPLEEFNAKIADMIVESLSSSPISDIHFLEELLSNDPLPLPENESSNFDHHNDLSFPRPPPEPLDVEIFFDFEPDMGVLTTKVVEDISENYVLMPKVLPSQPTLSPIIDPLLSFSSENEDKVFKPGILSYLLVSYREKITSAFFENPMMMISPDLEASRAHGFVHRPLEFQSLTYWNPIS
nr:hypothetical protein [Tanacetum cinerariifolium]